VAWEEFVRRTPLNERARADLVRLQTGTQDYLPGRSDAEKKKILTKISYETFLRDHAKVDGQLIEMYRKWGISYFCVGIDEIPALHVQWYNGMPGTEHTLRYESPSEDDPYIFHFPDGNASVARLLVRSLIPAAVPGSNQEDLVTSKVDYSLLDRDGPARIRLNSTVVAARHTARSDAVDVTYVRGGATRTVRARDCIMACYNTAIPYLCPELPVEQKQGLAYGVKVPLTYVKVLVPNWRAFADAGLRYVYFTNDFFKQVELDFPVSLGGYQASRTPDDPMILHMCYVHYARDIFGPEQWREGRRILLQTPFSTFEGHVRKQLDQALSATGFDAGRDIEAITVNRWPHGYSYDPTTTWEPEWPSEETKPWVIGRQPFGRIHIANSDAGASAMTQSAVMEAWRAVEEIEA
jgi:spermidine dehydrogenase